MKEFLKENLNYIIDNCIFEKLFIFLVVTLIIFI